MRVNCPHCQTKMIITHPVRISKRVSDLYTSCPNIDCGARCIMRLSHISDLTPPAATLTAAMHEWFANLPASIILGERRPRYLFLTGLTGLDLKLSVNFHQ